MNHLPDPYRAKRLEVLHYKKNNFKYGLIAYSLAGLIGLMIGFSI